MRVTIEEYNSVFIKLDFFDKDEENVFSDYVSEMLPNFAMLRRNPKLYQRFKNWDGKIKYYSKKTKLLYKGLLTNILTFCSERNLEVVNLLNPKKERDYTKYLDNLTISKFNYKTNSYNDITPDKFQKKAFNDALNNDISRIEMATGSGKTLFSYCLVHFLNSVVDGKICICVPRKDLANSFYEEYKGYCKFDDNFSIDDVSVIHSSSKMDSSAKINIITSQTLVNYDDDYLENVDVLLIDEAHKSKNNTLKSIISKCVNTKYRIGMSGTFSDGGDPNGIDNVKDSTLSDLSLQAYLGDVYKIVDQKTLIESGRASEFEARVYILNHKQKDKDLYFKLKSKKNILYKKEYDSKKIQKENLIKKIKMDIFEVKNKGKSGDIEKLENDLERLESTYIETVHKKWGYVDEVDFLKSCSARNNFILDCAMKNKHGNSVIMFKHIETHGDILHELMKKKLDYYDDLDVYYIHGKTKLKPDEAKKIVEKSQRRSNILANMSMVKEGWSVDNLHFCYMAASLKKGDGLIQVVGRLLRKDGSNKKTALYLFVDDLRDQDNNYSYDHGVENVRTIVNEGHKVLKKRINLDDYYGK